MSFFGTLGSIFKGTGVGDIIGGFNQGSEDRNQADLIQQNADIVKQNTADAESAAKMRETMAQGTVRADAGFNGVDFGGSIGDVLRMNARNAAFEQANIQRNGTFQETQLRTQAKSLKRAGQAAEIGGFVQAGNRVIQAFGIPGGGG